MISPATTTIKTSPSSQPAANSLTHSQVHTPLPLKNNNNTHFAARCPRTATVVTCNTKRNQRQQTPKKACQKSSSWNVQASQGSLLTSNPIREIIESINLAENPAKKVIPLSIGDPTIFGNLKPCKEILDSLRNAESSGKFYGYQTAAGFEEARQAVANYHFKNAGNKLEPRDVILTSGCSHAIDLCICVLAQAGQNILIPRPGFPLYKTLASVYGVEYKQYNLLAESDWSIDLEHLESLIDDNTAAIVINNPSNPCGSVFSKQHLLDILELAERYKKPIIADEIYDKFVFLPEHYAMHGVNPPTSQSNEKLHVDKFNQDNNAMTNNDITSTTTTTRAKIMRPTNNQHATESLTNNGASRKSLYNNQPKSDGFWSSEDDEEEDFDEEEQYDEIMVDEDGDAERDNDYNLIRQTTAIKKQNLLRLGHNHDNNDDNEQDYDRDSLSMSDLTTTSNDDQIPSDTPFIALSSLSKSVPILTCGGISKTCRIPGLRLGWIIVNDPVRAFEKTVRIGLNRLTQRLMGPNSLVQGALKEILDKVPESFYTSTMEFIFRNALLCYQRIGQMPGLEPYMPQGSMYLMVRFEPSAFPTIEGDLDFTSKLMNEESVLVLPGKCFEFPNYFRICLTVPTNVMEEALDRMSAFCERHHNALHNLTSTNRNSNIKVFR